MATLRVRRGAPTDVDHVVDANLAMAWETEGLRLDALTLRRGVTRALSGVEDCFYLIAEQPHAQVRVLEPHAWRPGRRHGGELGEESRQQGVARREPRREHKGAVQRLRTKVRQCGHAANSKIKVPSPGSNNQGQLNSTQIKAVRFS